jgi:hypothetical protein
MLPAFGIAEESFETRIFLGRSINLSVDPRVNCQFHSPSGSKEDGLHVTSKLAGARLLEIFLNV